MIETSSRPRMKVLLVDDNRDSADTLAAVLELWGYQTCVAYDAEDALASACADVPECIISDLGMPHLDGYELARRVRAETLLTNVRLICVSSYSDDETLRRVEEAGFDYRLTKPADTTKLREMLALIEQRK